MPLLSPQDTGALLALIRSARDRPLEATLADFTATFGSGLCFQALVLAASILEVSKGSLRLVHCAALFAPSVAAIARLSADQRRHQDCGPPHRLFPLQQHNESKSRSRLSPS